MSRFRNSRTNTRSLTSIIQFQVFCFSETLSGWCPQICWGSWKLSTLFVLDSQSDWSRSSPLGRLIASWKSAPSIATSKSPITQCWGDRRGQQTDSWGKCQQVKTKNAVAAVTQQYEPYEGNGLLGCTDNQEQTLWQIDFRLWTFLEPGPQNYWKSSHETFFLSWFSQSWRHHEKIMWRWATG